MLGDGSFERAKRSCHSSYFLLIHSYQNEIHPNVFVMDLLSRRDWGRSPVMTVWPSQAVHRDSVGAARQNIQMRCDDRARPAITRMTPAEYCLAKL